MNALTNLLEEPLSWHVGWALLHSVWQGAIIVACAALLLRCLRQASANVRYLTALTALALVAVAPAAMLLWSLAQHESPPRLSPASSDARFLVGDASAIAAETHDRHGELRGSAAGLSNDMVDAPPTLRGIDASLFIGAWRASASDWLSRVLPYVALAWLLGAAAMSLRLVYGWLLVQRMKQRAHRPAPLHVERAARSIARRLGIRRAVCVLQSSLVRVPTAVGWLRPVVLLPVCALTNLTPQELEAMLIHELAHIRRHDYLVNLLQSVVETLLFFHPAVWWLSRRIRIERENCCDDAAVALLGDRRAYARALYRTALLGVGSPQLASASTGGDLDGRFRRLLGLPQRGERPASTWAGILALVLLTAMIAGICASPVVAQSGASPQTQTVQTQTEQTQTEQVQTVPLETPSFILAQVQTVPPPPDEAKAKVEEPELPEGGPSARDIWSAAQALNRAVIKDLIGMEPRYLDVRHENGFAALHWAADTGRADAVELLLELGAKPNVKQGKTGGAPLQYAAANGQVAAVRELLEHMASVDAVDSIGRTPLMWAAMGGHDEVVKVLIEARADVNSAMNGGWTPLHYAVQAKDAKTAQRLLDAGADFTMKNVKGLTAFEVGPELDVHVPKDFKPRPPKPMPMPTSPAGSGGSSSGSSGSGSSGSGSNSSGSSGGDSDSRGSGAAAAIPDETPLRSRGGVRFVAAPFVTAPAPKEVAGKTGRVAVRVSSTEYEKAGGRLERAILSIQNEATGDRIALLYAENLKFDVDLPTGSYKLQFTGNGSRGATFQAATREISIEEPAEGAGVTAVDLGTVDLALTTTSRLFGRPAPELDGIVAWKHTKPLRLSELRGKVVVLDFWGWYCTICHQHKPDLASLNDEFRDRGLQVVAVHDGSLKSMDEVNEHLEDIARRYWRGKDLHLPIALDRSGEGSVFGAYGITAVPAVLLVDQEGRVVRRFHHAGDPELKAEIERLLK